MNAWHAYKSLDDPPRDLEARWSKYGRWGLSFITIRSAKTKRTLRKEFMSEDGWETFLLNLGRVP